MQSIARLINQCHEELRAGRADHCARLLRDLPINEIKREPRLPLARIARRAGLVSLGMKLLSPIIHRTLEVYAGPPSIEEWAEYALLLQRSGGVREAMSILRGPGMESFVETLLYRAFCNFNLWDHGAAISDLDAYVSRVADPYAKLIGATNLASAYLFNGRLAEGERLARANIVEAESGGHARLLSNNRETLAMTLIERGDFTRAKHELDRGLEGLAHSKTTDQLYLRKGLAAIAAFTTGSPEPLQTFRGEAVERGHFETVRECDFLSLRVQYRDDVFRHLYFGTPYRAYRERMCRLLIQPPPEGEYLLGADDSLTMNLRTGAGLSSQGVQVGSKTHQLIEILFRDLYRPMSLGAMFSQLFPDERYNLNTSPDRVHQILRRARKDLREGGSTLRIEESGRLYRIHRGSLAILIPRQHELMGWENVQILQLKQAIGVNRPFTSREARDTLGLSIANFKRLSYWGVEQGVLGKVGKGSGTAYILKAAG